MVTRALSCHRTGPHFKHAADLISQAARRADVHKQLAWQQCRVVLCAVASRGEKPCQGHLANAAAAKLQLCAGQLDICTEVTPDAAVQRGLSHPVAGAGNHAGACSH